MFRWVQSHTLITNFVCTDSGNLTFMHMEKDQ